MMIAGHDPVTHPKHYNVGKIPVIDFVEDQELSFHLALAVQYICRAGRKTPDPTEDIRKAIWYLERYLKLRAMDAAAAAAAEADRRLEEWLNNRPLPRSVPGEVKVHT
jgi:hypothetical protein